jgi:hypothetical protein
MEEEELWMNNGGGAIEEKEWLRKNIVGIKDEEELMRME